MRIGLVCPYDLGQPGGVQAQVFGLATALETLGDDVTIIGPGLPENLDGVDLGTTVAIPGNGSMAPITIDPRTRKLLRVAARDLDVLHVHEPLMPVASVAALRAGPPVVATFHAAPGGLIGRLYRALRSQIGRVLGPNVRRITAVSRIAAAPLPSALGVTLIPNGIDVASFQSTVDRIDGRVSFLGRDEPRKGLDTLLAAWPTVRERHGEAELVVMGAKREDASVTWMGRVDGDTKAQVLASSAVYVAPNTGGESFGIVLVEAMAAGAPVLASALDSFQDVGGEAARYFTVGDAQDLGERLIALLDSPSERAEMSRIGLEHVQQYDWSSVAQSYRGVYEEALS